MSEIPLPIFFLSISLILGISSKSRTLVFCSSIALAFFSGAELGAYSERMKSSSTESVVTEVSETRETPVVDTETL